ncbi:glycosyl hydrolase 115 family protein [Butyrivibrio proteoclasticus]|uniref:glycosyl hydrolase 115 family protein n=1 Tax=Butyrivibrio proteoclasticus TaxID=43305 RepID=UPI000552397F|nr:glycosyl hydrolase 115 family protein [Butyrivibrio proteoclasticus]
MSDRKILITSNSWILGDLRSPALEMAAASLGRDILNTCNRTNKEGIDIRLLAKKSIEPDCFVIEVKGGELMVEASNDLGFIYGMYHISKSFLGVDEFWFWNEQSFDKRDGYQVPEDYHYQSEPFKVKFRGWFVNDEVLIDEWNLGEDKEKAWEMAFETLLRCGGNMTIPGTDTNAHIYCELASKMGLWITHHHAEPLGAEMFARAYPDLEASYDKYPKLFEKLWKEAIIKQKNYKVIWNLGFRGQGDRPFWADDKAYDTDEKRGKLISSLIRKQYDMVKKADKDAICCSNLYGETMELYQKGLIDLPEDVIFIWADNGFGKMVSRRQGNHNPRVYALPKEAKGRHGIYYHASFYDLQAAAQMTMLPNSPEFVIKELNQVFDKNADDFWIINCSNIKPHAFLLGLIADYWKRGRLEIPKQSSAKNKEKKENPDNVIAAYVDDYRNSYCIRYYGKKYSEVIAELYKLWPKYAPSYGPNEDDHAGEQFFNHGARVLTTGFISSFNTQKPSATRAADEWLWFSNKKTLMKQIEDYKKVIEPATRGYQEYLLKCREVSSEISRAVNRTLEDTFIWQVEYNYYSCLGALHTCNALEACLIDFKKDTADVDKAEDKVIDCISQGEDAEGGPDYLKAFYEAGLAAKAFKEGYDRMRSHEHGVFKGFFDNDCEADIRQSYYVLKGLMSYVRFQGDGPHFYKWQRMFQEGAGGNKVHLILRVKKHLNDEELWELIIEYADKIRKKKLKNI